MAPSRILGFYTLSAAQVDVQQLSDTDRKKLPRYPAPLTLYLPLGLSDGADR